MGAAGRRVRMNPRMRNAEKTKAAILKAARRLFAERGHATVSIRDIAKAAGVSHGLVQQYFGTRRHMVAAIIQDEIEEFGKLSPPDAAGRSVVSVRNMLIKSNMARFQGYALLIMRAELAGDEPEKLLDPSIPTPAMRLADTIRDLQAKAPASARRMDPRLVSAYINASLFAFATMYPWLMTAVGLKPGDYAARLDELAEISVKLIALAAHGSRNPGRRRRRSK